MREILFRGKRKDNGEWVEGFYVCLPLANYDEKVQLMTNAETGVSYEIIPETVGQFTGLTDKNGKKIFEGDIIHSFYANCPKNEHIEKVSFFDGTFSAEGARGGFYSRLSGQGSPKHIPWDKSVYMIECEVIGNIHDNPELLKGGAKE
jgi:uncharacterized phage protein (TIGR01671 family)